MHVKSKGGSQMGLSLQFSSVMNEMNKSTCYHQVSKIASERIIHGGTVAIDGHVLTEIRAVCYRKKPTHTELLSEFGADNQETAPDPSPADMKITWKLKDGNNHLLPKYNIYAEKLAKQVDGNAAGKLVDTREYLGMAYVQAFYMSDPSISCHIGSLKFIIQVCAADGTCQELDDSP
ncbi:hypothetical protein DKX38_012514 [Salix brachista]|uniref:Cytosolic endo-beta-N-acetylglucosaminidase C-terminal domain-containing protein n=1 Tax=Salix brachista TaxID=2182728 RepID=A0A5N5LP52_9ROSI|nr:hypothetical protein DKX38_012514 [Salix brachista]